MIKLITSNKGNKHMLEIFNEVENMFRRMDALAHYPLADFTNRGLKSIIHRPHNLLTKKDESGNVIGYQVAVVYTPFSKNDVKVEVLNNQLTVKCGSENKIKDEDMDYCGISHQAYSFTIPLSDIVDVNAITAKADDGILYIDLPIKKIEEKKIAPLSIEVK